MLRITTTAPGPQLRAHVRRIAVWTERSEPLRRTEVPPAGTTLVLSLGPDMFVDGRWIGSFAGGLYDRPIETGHGGEQAGVQIDLHALAARPLLGIPMHELRNRTVPLEDLLPGVAELLERLAETPEVAARRAILDAFMARRLADAPAPRPELAYAHRRLAETHGAARIEQIARELGWSRRHLAAQFREHVGASPKTLARLLRFERAVALVRAGESFAEAAFAAGYADQPHWGREFRALMGMAPSEFPFVQDAPGAA